MSGVSQIRTVSYVLLLFIICIAVVNAEYSSSLSDEMNRSPKEHSMYDLTRQSSNNGSFIYKLVSDNSKPNNTNATDLTVAAAFKRVSKLSKEFKDIREKRRHHGSKPDKEHLGQTTTAPLFHAKLSKHDHRRKKKTHEEKSKRQKNTPKGLNYKVHHRPHSKEIPLETEGDSLRHRMSSSRSKDKYRPRSNKSIRKNYKTVTKEPDDTKSYLGLKSGELPLMSITQATTVTPGSKHELPEFLEEEALETLRQMHIELIKEKILRLLHLDKPPEVPKKPIPEFPKVIRSSLMNMAQSDEPDSRERNHFHAPQTVIFAEDELLQCTRKSAKCVYFKMGKLERQEVLSAELWMYKEYDSSDHNNHTFVIYELEQTSYNSSMPQLRQVVGSLETGIKKGWVKLDVLDTVSFWVNKPHRNNGIQILCKTCKTGPGRLTPVATSVQVRPVLVVKFAQPYRRSLRSNSDICHSRNKICCRQPFTIDFKAINWDDWIVYPKSFETSYCRGDCERHYRIPTLLSHHSRMVLHTHTKAKPCCAPTKMREVSVLVRDDRLQYTKKNLEIKVTQCGCAT